jgi:hypothetical protein
MSIFDFFSSSARRVGADRGSKITAAKNSLDIFVSKTLNDLIEEGDVRIENVARTTIIDNARVHIARMEEIENTFQEVALSPEQAREAAIEFNRIHKEVTNMGDYVYPRHPLNRDLTQYPEVDNSLWGWFTRMFTLRWRYEPYERGDDEVNTDLGNPPVVNLGGVASELALPESFVGNCG